MFPFGIFPFNVIPMFGPWWPIQAAQMQSNMPPLMKTYMEACTAWSTMMTQSNPWMASYMKMLEENPALNPMAPLKK